MAVQKSQKSKSKKTFKKNTTIIKFNCNYNNTFNCKKNQNMLRFCKKLFF